jgi:hypothetical protein
MACSFFLFANDLVAFYVSGLHFVFSFALGGRMSFWLLAFGLVCVAFRFDILHLFCSVQRLESHHENGIGGTLMIIWRQFRFESCFVSRISGGRSVFVG